MPPGTGDAQISISQRLQLSGAVIVSTPQDIALIDARRGANMFEKVRVPILGLIENMSYFKCPHCGGKSHIFGCGGVASTAKDMNLELLGEVPLNIEVREMSDLGKPIVVSSPDSEAARIYERLASRILEKLKEQRKSSSDDERTDTDKDQDLQEYDREDIPKEAEAAYPSEYEKSDEEDTSTPLKKKSQKPRSREQVVMDEAMVMVEARRKELADATAAKAAKTAKPTTMEEARKLRMEKAKALQKERKRLEAKEKAQEKAEAAQAAQTQEREVIDLSGTVEYLKKIEREKHTAEQRAAQLAREKIKETLSKEAEEPVLEPSQGSP
ncbi:hypothetical protein L7F22_068946 [Adiantum nelumboides]|nr:hypothetical protein [Adiantum nelumboides]